MILVVASSENKNPPVVTTAETIMASEIGPATEGMLVAIGKLLTSVTGVAPRSLKLLIEWADGEVKESQEIDLSQYTNPNLN